MHQLHACSRTRVLKHFIEGQSAEADGLIVLAHTAAYVLCCRLLFLGMHHFFAEAAGEGVTRSAL